MKNKAAMWIVSWESPPVPSNTNHKGQKIKSECVRVWLLYFS